MSGEKCVIVRTFNVKYGGKALKLKEGIQVKFSGYHCHLLIDSDYALATEDLSEFFWFQFGKLRRFHHSKA